MQYFFTQQGSSSLFDALRFAPLLAFDFDGTLAPIVAHPDAVHMSEGIKLKLIRLSTHLPIAIITGRSIKDIKSHLTFKPTYIVGNHGAEDPGDPVSLVENIAALDELRRVLLTHHSQLIEVGIMVEDKGASIALHYRLSRSAALAQNMIEEIAQTVSSKIQLFAGKMVVNAVARQANNKFDAIRSLLERSQRTHAFFAGDDINDESVFIAAPKDWLTLRIGHDQRSAARFYLNNQQEMAFFLDRILQTLKSINPSAGSPN